MVQQVQRHERDSDPFVTQDLQFQDRVQRLRRRKLGLKVVAVVVAVVVVVIVVAAVIKLHQEKAWQAKNLDQSKTNKQPHKRSLVYLNYRPLKVVLHWA